MADRIVHDPQETGRDLPVAGAVDTLGGTGTTPRTREGSKRLFPDLFHAVDQNTGHFLRLLAKYVGLVDGHEVGELTLGADSSILNSLSASWSGLIGVQDIMRTVRGDLRQMLLTGLTARGIIMEPERQGIVEKALVRLLGTKQGHLLTFDLGMLLSGVQRKYVGIDAGAYVSPAAPAGVADLTSTVTFTGVLLGNLVRRIYNVTDDMVHTIIPPVVEPAGGAVGTLTVTPAIPSANAVLRIPFSSTPFAWNSATDATQVLPIAASPKGVNGPAWLYSNAALAEGAAAYDMPFAFSNYDTLTVSGYWACGGADTYQLDILARIDDLAAPGDLVNVNTLFLPAGVLGVPSVGPTTVQVSTIQRVQWREVVARRTKVGVAAASVRFGCMVGR